MASNGVFLPDDRKLATQMGLPGHWTQHPMYTADIEDQISALNQLAPNLSDTQLALGIKSIQINTANGLMPPKYAVDPTSDVK